MNPSVEFEVVLRLEGLFTDLTLEPAASAVSGEVASEVPFTRKHLTATERADQIRHYTGVCIVCVCSPQCELYLLTVGAGEVV